MKPIVYAITNHHTIVELEEVLRESETFAGEEYDNIIYAAADQDSIYDVVQAKKYEFESADKGQLPDNSNIFGNLEEALAECERRINDEVRVLERKVLEAKNRLLKLKIKYTDEELVT